MDLKDINNKPELLNKINALTTEYNTMLKGLANSLDTYKKSALLYYWLRDYKRLLLNEKNSTLNFRLIFTEVVLST